MRSLCCKLAASVVVLSWCLAAPSRAVAQSDPDHDVQQCTMNLKKIHEAIQAYRREHKSLPNWLSDLDLDEGTLVCPAVPSEGALAYPELRDPKSNTTYFYEFCNVPVPEGIWGGSSHTMREWKERQMGLVGGEVPIVRCHHHMPVLNLGFDGKIFASPQSWETLHLDVAEFQNFSPAALFADVSERQPLTPRMAISPSVPKAYVRVEYMRVPEGGDELYRNVERAWKKIHQARRDAGYISSWTLFKVHRESGPDSDYQYAVVHLGDSLDKIGADYTDLYQKISFTDEDYAILEKTADARELLRSDDWQLASIADPERLKMLGADATCRIGLMTSNDANTHLELENNYWKKIWAQGVKDGNLWNWELWSRLSGTGPNLVSVHMFPEGKADQTIDWIPDAATKAFPDLTDEQLGDALARTGPLREMTAVEIWTVVDAVNPVDVPPPRPER